MHLLLLLTTLAFAADPNTPHPHQGIVRGYAGAPPAVTLSAEESATLASGEMVLKQVRSDKGGRGVAFMDIRATPATVWSRIVNYAMYPTWVDNVAACEVYKREGSNIYARFLLDPMGMKIEYFVKHVYNPTAGWLTWTLDYSRSSDLDDSVGYWRVTPVSAQPPLSRLEYSVDIRFSGWVPQFAQDALSKKGLSTAVTWVKKQSEG